MSQVSGILFSSIVIQIVTQIHYLDIHISHLAIRVAAGFNSGLLDLCPCPPSLLSLLSYLARRKKFMLLFMMSLTYLCDLSLLTRLS